MASKDAAIKALCKSLGKEYRVCTIDFEPVIYRDFGNGFNVEISEVYTTSKRRKAKDVYADAIKRTALATSDMQIVSETEDGKPFDIDEIEDIGTYLM